MKLMFLVSFFAIGHCFFLDELFLPFEVERLSENMTASNEIPMQNSQSSISDQVVNTANGSENVQNLTNLRKENFTEMLTSGKILQAVADPTFNNIANITKASISTIQKKLSDDEEGPIVESNLVDRPNFFQNSNLAVQMPMSKKRDMRGDNGNENKMNILPTNESIADSIKQLAPVLISEFVNGSMDIPKLSLLDKENPVVKNLTSEAASQAATLMTANTSPNASALEKNDTGAVQPVLLSSRPSKGGPGIIGSNFVVETFMFRDLGLFGMDRPMDKKRSLRKTRHMPRFYLI